MAVLMMVTDHMKPVVMHCKFQLRYSNMKKEVDCGVHIVLHLVACIPLAECGCCSFP